MSDDERDAPEAPHAPPAAPTEPAQTEPSELPKKWVIVGFSLAVLAGLCTAMLFVKAQRAAVSKDPPKGAPLAFVDVAPVPIELNDDGVEDFAAIARDATGKVAIVAFNGKTLREAWHSDPLGGLVGLERARLVAAGDAVIAIRPEGAGAIAHVLQVRSGRALRDVTLAVQPASACATGASVFLGLADRSVLVLDVAAGTTREATLDEGGCARATWVSPSAAARRSYAITGGKLTVAERDGRVVGVVESR
jgi:hypothetical protein